MTSNIVDSATYYYIKTAEKSRLISQQEKEIVVRNLWSTRMGFSLAILLLLLISSVGNHRFYNG